MAFSTIPTAGLSTGGANFRNLIINGDMSIAQRGTSVSSVTTTGYRTCDRFQPLMNSAGTWTISQSTDVPTGQGFANSFKFDCTSAQASPNYLIFKHAIEGQNLQHLKKGTSSAESVTLSFWVKSNKTGTYQVNLRDQDNTRQIGSTYSISSANTWEKKTITFAGDTTGTFDNDNNGSLQVEWWLASGSTYNTGSVPTSWEASDQADRAAGLTVNLADSTSNDWYLTGVQLEVGTTASDFEFLPYDVNLRRCQRYYQRPMDFDNSVKGYPICYTHSNVAVRGTQELPVTMRTSATYFAPTVTNGYRFTINGGNYYLNTITGTPELQSVFHNTDITGLGFPTNSQGHMFVNASGAYVELDAEL